MLRVERSSYTKFRITADQLSHMTESGLKTVHIAENIVSSNLSLSTEQHLWNRLGWTFATGRVGCFIRWSGYSFYSLSFTRSGPTEAQYFHQSFS